VTRDPLRRRLLGLAIVSAAIAVLSGQLFDWPISRWVADHGQSPVWAQIVGVLEYVFGVAPWDELVPLLLLVGTLVTWLVPHWRRASRAWVYLTLVNLLARNLMMWGKLFSGRFRPHQWVHLGTATFGHVGAGTSFPSGHVTLFGSLILPLVVVVPRSWPLLVVLPFIMIARIAVLAHFVSDVFGALAMVAFVAWLCFPVLRLPIAPAATPSESRSGRGRD